MRITDIFEVLVLHPKELHSQPLMDSETIKVYHGTNSVELCYAAVTVGFSGDIKADRNYSYEFVNNPKGLFVTPDINTAKKFGRYIIEFHSKVSDLEAPVWANGTFTVQGEISGAFKDDDERKQERNRARNQFMKSNNSVIANSDRPELAASLLFSGERQALFIGNVNANGIKAIWLLSDGKYKRISPRDFSKIVLSGFHDSLGNNINIDKLNKDSTPLKGVSRKVGKPRDKMDWDILIDLVLKYKPFGEGKDIEYIKEILSKKHDYIRRLVWNDTQYSDIVATIPDSE